MHFKWIVCIHLRIKAEFQKHSLGYSMFISELSSIYLYKFPGFSPQLALIWSVNPHTPKCPHGCQQCCPPNISGSLPFVVFCLHEVTCSCVTYFQRNVSKSAMCNFWEESLNASDLICHLSHFAMIIDIRKWILLSTWVLKWLLWALPLPRQPCLWLVK